MVLITIFKMYLPSALVLILALKTVFLPSLGDMERVYTVAGLEQTLLEHCWNIAGTLLNIAGLEQKQIWRLFGRPWSGFVRCFSFRVFSKWL